jgi:hypothetical protein
MEYREHRAGAAGCAGTGEVWEKSDGPVRGSPDSARFKASTGCCPPPVAVLSLFSTVPLLLDSLATLP